MPAQLTPSELACVRAAGEGLDDKQIARALKIPSHRTVQRHLNNAYRKLGVNDRRTAAMVVRRDYADLPIPIAAVPPPLASSERPVETPDLGGFAEARPWLARVWRPPPKNSLVRISLSMAVAVIWILVLGGLFAVLDRVFEVTDQFRPS